MKIGALMSYCVINEHKLHCQCYLQFYVAQNLHLCLFNYSIQRIFVCFFALIKISHYGQIAHLEASVAHEIQN